MVQTSRTRVISTCKHRYPLAGSRGKSLTRRKKGNGQSNSGRRSIDIGIPRFFAGKARPLQNRTGFGRSSALLDDPSQALRAAWAGIERLALARFEGPVPSKKGHGRRVITAPPVSARALCHSAAASPQQGSGAAATAGDCGRIETRIAEVFAAKTIPRRERRSRAPARARGDVIDVRVRTDLRGAQNARQPPGAVSATETDDRLPPAAVPARTDAGRE